MAEKRRLGRTRQTQRRARLAWYGQGWIAWTSDLSGGIAHSLPRRDLDRLTYWCGRHSPTIGIDDNLCSL